MNRKPPLKERAPELYAQFDFEKNQGVDIDKIPASSHTLLWWKCNNGHSWQEYLSSRLYGAKRCPICAKSFPHENTKTLAEEFPLIAADWDFDKNEMMSPETVASKSGNRIYWKCHKCGHEWRASIINRTVGATRCPRCGKERT